MDEIERTMYGSLFSATEADKVSLLDFRLKSSFWEFISKLAATRKLYCLSFKVSLSGTYPGEEKNYGGVYIFHFYQNKTDDD